jgi:hypothetical protein
MPHQEANPDHKDFVNNDQRAPPAPQVSATRLNTTDAATRPQQAGATPEEACAPAQDDQQSSATAPGLLLLSGEAAVSAHLGGVVAARDRQQR